MRVLVTGATGNVGREVVKLLLRDGLDVTAVSRKAASAALPGNARLAEGDPSRPSTLASAMDGVNAIFLVPRAVGAAAAELLSLARERGVGQVVVISAMTVVYPAGERRFAEQFEVVETIAKASGLAWTILRCGDFDSNSLAWAPQVRAGAIIRGAYGKAATSPIHERDIASVAVRAFADKAHLGQTHVLTGPHSLSQYDKARLLGEVLGKELTFQEIPPEQVRQAMLAQGLPEEIPDRLLGSLADYAERPGPTSEAVKWILGRPARTFAEWAAEHTATFRTDLDKTKKTVTEKEHHLPSR